MADVWGFLWYSWFCLRFYRVLLGFIGFYWIFVGFLVLLGDFWSFWALLKYRLGIICYFFSRVLKQIQVFLLAPSNYHFVWKPPTNIPERTCCRVLVGFTGLKCKCIYIYIFT